MLERACSHRDQRSGLWRRGRGRVGTGGKARNGGALLLEVLIALAVFVGAGLAIISVLEQSLSAMSRMRDARQASDLAASAMARLEAGIDTPETLDGEVPAWEDQSDGSTLVAPAGGRWEIDVRTDTSQFPGVIRVTVEAIKYSSDEGSDAVRASWKLSQLIRGEAAPTENAAVDEIQRAQLEAAERAGGGER